MDTSSSKGGTNSLDHKTPIAAAETLHAENQDEHHLGQSISCAADTADQLLTKIADIVEDLNTKQIQLAQSIFTETYDDKSKSQFPLNMTDNLPEGTCNASEKTKEQLVDLSFVSHVEMTTETQEVSSKDMPENYPTDVLVIEKNISNSECLDNKHQKTETTESNLKISLATSEKLKIDNISGTPLESAKTDDFISGQDSIPLFSKITSEVKPADSQCVNPEDQIVIQPPDFEKLNNHQVSDSPTEIQLKQLVEGGSPTDASPKEPLQSTPFPDYIVVHKKKPVSVKETSKKPGAKLTSLLQKLSAAKGLEIASENFSCTGSVTSIKPTSSLKHETEKNYIFTKSSKVSENSPELTETKQTISTQASIPPPCVIDDKSNLSISPKAEIDLSISPKPKSSVSRRSKSFKLSAQTDDQTDNASKDSANSPTTKESVTKVIKNGCINIIRNGKVLTPDGQTSKNKPAGFSLLQNKQKQVTSETATQVFTIYGTASDPKNCFSPLVTSFPPLGQPTLVSADNKNYILGYVSMDGSPTSQPMFKVYKAPNPLVGNPSSKTSNIQLAKTKSKSQISLLQPTSAQASIPTATTGIRKAPTIYSLLTNPSASTSPGMKTVQQPGSEAVSASVATSKPVSTIIIQSSVKSAMVPGLGQAKLIFAPHCQATNAGQFFFQPVLANSSAYAAASGVTTLVFSKPGTISTVNETATLKACCTQSPSLAKTSAQSATPTALVTSSVSSGTIPVTSGLAVIPKKTCTNSKVSSRIATNSTSSNRQTSNVTPATIPSSVTTQQSFSSLITKLAEQSVLSTTKQSVPSTTKHSAPGTTKQSVTSTSKNKQVVPGTTKQSVPSTTKQSVLSTTTQSVTSTSRNKQVVPGTTTAKQSSETNLLQPFTTTNQDVQEETSTTAAPVAICDSNTKSPAKSVLLGTNLLHKHGVGSFGKNVTAAMLALSNIEQPSKRGRRSKTAHSVVLSKTLNTLAVINKQNSSIPTTSQALVDPKIVQASTTVLGIDASSKQTPILCPKPVKVTASHPANIPNVTLLPQTIKLVVPATAKTVSLLAKSVIQNSLLTPKPQKRSCSSDSQIRTTIMPHGSITATNSLETNSASEFQSNSASHVFQQNDKTEQSNIVVQNSNFKDISARENSIASKKPKKNAVYSATLRTGQGPVSVMVVAPDVDDDSSDASISNLSLAGESIFTPEDCPTSSCADKSSFLSSYSSSVTSSLNLHLNTPPPRTIVPPQSQKNSKQIVFGNNITDPSGLTELSADPIPPSQAVSDEFMRGGNGEAKAEGRDMKHTEKSPISDQCVKIATKNVTLRDLKHVEKSPISDQGDQSITIPDDILSKNVFSSGIVSNQLIVKTSENSGQIVEDSSTKDALVDNMAVIETSSQRVQQRVRSLDEEDSDSDLDMCSAEEQDMSVLRQLLTSVPLGSSELLTSIPQGSSDNSTTTNKLLETENFLIQEVTEKQLEMMTTKNPSMVSSVSESDRLKYKLPKNGASAKFLTITPATPSHQDQADVLDESNPRQSDNNEIYGFKIDSTFPLSGYGDFEDSDDQNNKGDDDDHEDIILIDSSKEQNPIFRINESDNWENFVSPCFVVLERLSKGEIFAKQSGNLLSKCSKHCRKRTLDYLCNLKLLRCVNHPNVSLFQKPKKRPKLKGIMRKVKHESVSREMSVSGNLNNSSELERSQSSPWFKGQGSPLVGAQVSLKLKGQGSSLEKGHSSQLLRGQGLLLANDQLPLVRSQGSLFLKGQGSLPPIDKVSTLAKGQSSSGLRVQGSLLVKGQGSAQGSSIKKELPSQLHEKSTDAASDSHILENTIKHKPDLYEPDKSFLPAQEKQKSNILAGIDLDVDMKEFYAGLNRLKKQVDRKRKKMSRLKKSRKRKEQFLGKITNKLKVEQKVKAKKLSSNKVTETLVVSNSATNKEQNEGEHFSSNKFDAGRTYHVPSKNKLKSALVSSQTLTKSAKTSGGATGADVGSTSQSQTQESGSNPTTKSNISIQPKPLKFTADKIKSALHSLSKYLAATGRKPTEGNTQFILLKIDDQHILVKLPPSSATGDWQGRLNLSDVTLASVKVPDDLAACHVSQHTQSSSHSQTVSAKNPTTKTETMISTTIPPLASKTVSFMNPITIRTTSKAVTNKNNLTAKSSSNTLTFSSGKKANNLSLASSVKKGVSINKLSLLSSKLVTTSESPASKLNTPKATIPNPVGNVKRIATEPRKTVAEILRTVSSTAGKKPSVQSPFTNDLNLHSNATSLRSFVPLPSQKNSNQIIFGNNIIDTSGLKESSNRIWLSQTVSDDPIKGGTGEVKAELSRLPPNSSLLPERKRKTSSLSEEERKAKLRKLHEKYPLPPGVIIKSEPDDNFEYEASSDWLQPQQTTLTDDSPGTCSVSCEPSQDSRRLHSSNLQTAHCSTSACVEDLPAFDQVDASPRQTFDNDETSSTDELDEPPPLLDEATDDADERPQEDEVMDTPENMPPVLQPMFTSSSSSLVRDQDMDPEPTNIIIEDSSQASLRKLSMASSDNTTAVTCTSVTSMHSDSSRGSGVDISGYHTNVREFSAPTCKNLKIQHLKELLKKKEREIENMKKMRAELLSFDLDQI